MFNAGYTDWQSCGAMEYFGQDEQVAGVAAGKKLAAAGAKNVLCVLQAQGRPSSRPGARASSWVSAPRAR